MQRCHATIHDPENLEIAPASHGETAVPGICRVESRGMWRTFRHQKPRIRFSLRFIAIFKIKPANPKRETRHYNASSIQDPGQIQVGALSCQFDRFHI